MKHYEVNFDGPETYLTVIVEAESFNQAAIAGYEAMGKNVKEWQGARVKNISSQRHTGSSNGSGMFGIYRGVNPVHKVTELHISEH